MMNILKIILKSTRFENLTEGGHMRGYLSTELNQFVWCYSSWELSHVING